MTLSERQREITNALPGSVVLSCDPCKVIYIIPVDELEQFKHCFLCKRPNIVIGEK